MSFTHAQWHGLRAYALPAMSSCFQQREISPDSPLSCSATSSMQCRRVSRLYCAQPPLPHPYLAAYSDTTNLALLTSPIEAAAGTTRLERVPFLSRGGHSLRITLGSDPMVVQGGLDEDVMDLISGVLQPEEADFSVESKGDSPPLCGKNSKSDSFQPRATSACGKRSSDSLDHGRLVESVRPRATGWRIYEGADVGIAPGRPVAY